jgi:hypothetical protein
VVVAPYRPCRGLRRRAIPVVLQDEVLDRLNRYEGVAFEVLDQTLEDILVEYAADEETNREAGEND